jgi:hypothetical protein
MNKAEFGQGVCPNAGSLKRQSRTRCSASRLAGYSPLLGNVRRESNACENVLRETWGKRCAKTNGINNAAKRR